jgi:YD repeat-containing protein
VQTRQVFCCHGTKPHAVTSAGSYIYQYDANGNPSTALRVSMTLRAELSGTQRITFTQQFNVENRLVAVTNTVSGQVTRFTYNGDGARVLEVSSNITTAYVGGHYEKVSNVVTPTKYYMLSGKRVATRNASGLYYLHGDHLGSSSLTTHASGSIVSQLRYPSASSGCTCPSAARGLPPTRG